MRKGRTTPEGLLHLVLVSLFAVAAVPQIGAAGVARPGTVTLKQPDGIAIEARLWGDESANGYETVDGRWIVVDPADGNWYYAQRDAVGRVTASRRRVGRDAPSGLEPPRRSASSPAPRPRIAVPPHSGNHRVLVVVVDFTPSTSHGVTEAEFRQHFFVGGGALSPLSVKDYWAEVSYGQIVLTPAAETYGTVDDGIVFVTLPHANPLCSASFNSTCTQGLTREAILAANPVVDFGAFDDNGDGYLSTDELHLYVIVRGLEGSFAGNSCGPYSTWAHRWSLDANTPAPTVDGVVVGDPLGAPTAGPQQGGYIQEGEWLDSCYDAVPGHMATIGISAHELGHDLGTGLPDLYDAASGTGTNSHGMGIWDLMAEGEWNGTTPFQGDLPSWPGAYGRWWLGLFEPVAIDAATSISLPQVETASAANPGVFRIPAGDYVHWSFCDPGSGEYWLLENRQKVGFDGGLPGAGLLIWHVHEDMSFTSSCRPNGDEGTTPRGKARLLTLEQADGLFDLECFTGGGCNAGDGTDPWSAATATTFDDASTPNTRFWSGEPSGVRVDDISASSATMTAEVLVPVCGDGNVDFPETCDDGGTADGDGCSSTCGEEQCYACAGAPSVCTADPGAACDDGNGCTGGDLCDGAAHCSGAADIGEACDDGLTCTGNDACGADAVCHGQATPLPVCESAPRATLLLRDNADAARDKIVWNWKASSEDDYGTPPSTAFSLCVYDADSLALSLGVPANTGLWRSLGGGAGWRYLDSSLSNDGVRKLLLRRSKPAKSNGAVVLLGKGADLGLANLSALQAPVTIQLRNDDGSLCWQSSFAAADVSHSDAAVFKARVSP